MTTLRARLFRGHVVLLAITLAALLALTSAVTRSALEHDADQVLRDKVALLARAADKANPTNAFLLNYEKTYGNVSLLWQTHTPDGVPAMAPEDVGQVIPLSVAAARLKDVRDPPLLESLKLVNGTPVRVATCAVDYRGTLLFYAQVAMPQSVISARWHTLLMIGGGATGLAVTALLLLHFWHGSWFRSLGLATESARRLGAAQLANERLAVAEDEPEIAALATAFNQLLSRMEHAQNSQRRFVADASHELRTPLTILRGEIDVTLRKPRSQSEYEKTLQSAKEELERLSHLVENLLGLAHADAGEVASLSEPVDLAELAHTVAERLASVADQKGVMLQVDVPQPVAVRGHGPALERAVYNLVENGLRHTPGGEEECVRVRITAEGQNAILTVKDTGTGIAPEHIPHVFERFYRVDSARNRTRGGAGLGLAIVKSIVEAHSGTVSVISELGKGSTFVISLPIGNVEATSVSQEADMPTAAGAAAT
jgi:heavy metal sensor kinase